MRLPVNYNNLILFRIHDIPRNSSLIKIPSLFFFVRTVPAQIGRFCVRMNGDLFISDLDTEELFGRDIIDDEDHFERDIDAEEFFGPESLISWTSNTIIIYNLKNKLMISDDEK